MDRLVKESEIGFQRWHSVRFKSVRMSTEELEVLQVLFPSYRLWLICGEIAPEIGQTSPEYDDANSKLPNQDAG
ncbi:hypothetical protein PALA31_05488 [Pseudomonas aeruginosa]|nr:hypothetical protein AJ72_05479 [Pseudomonas aeruginosa BWH032]MDA1399215.1 hypothetical protein [Pseudomonas aeruginosa]